jgi:hypothetical protein
MAFLPLAGARQGDDTGHMHVRSLARRVRAVLDEMNYASARITALKLSEGLETSDRAPDTYAEFLLRTSPLVPGGSPHEPPARSR